MSPQLQFINKASQTSNSECLIWPFSKDKFGYGLHGKRNRAHRTSFAIHVGPIPNNFIIMHTCDNPSCINPSHLKAGTQADNMSDMLKKNRAKRSFSHIDNSGEKHGRSKLTTSQVLEIRLRVSQKEINKTEASKIYGVSNQQISDICSFKRWKHLKQQ
jgi:hypothetical protein